MKINEIFYSLQGEGYFTGTPAVFVRFSGCNRACDFCDTDFAAYTEMTEDEILDKIKQYPTKHVVLTGGEPALQITDTLLMKLMVEGIFTQVETNGSLPLSNLVNWVTCSPKAPPYKIKRVDELKIVYQGNDPEEIAKQLGCKPKVKMLQPCSGLNTAATVNYILEHPGWRLSLQTHKMIDIK